MAEKTTATMAQRPISFHLTSASAAACTVGEGSAKICPAATFRISERIRLSSEGLLPAVNSAALLLPSPSASAPGSPSGLVMEPN